MAPSVSTVACLQKRSKVNAWKQNRKGASTPQYFPGSSSSLQTGQILELDLELQFYSYKLLAQWQACHSIPKQCSYVRVRRTHLVAYGMMTNSAEKPKELGKLSASIHELTLSINQSGRKTMILGRTYHLRRAFS